MSKNGAKGHRQVSTLYHDAARQQQEAAHTHEAHHYEIATLDAEVTAERERHAAYLKQEAAKNAAAHDEDADSDDT